ncbi:pyridoxamine 5'-phosphate oxidase family protein [Gilliamella sp. B2776]|uniref:HugZ family pyridoxamine 5'-phosphate oxidase n=1 Tax=unclassified Gilliamella TaxID=2685620 RepID=UPI0022699B2C|nr:MULTISPECIES: pyridoxamine 5'-phosphate oxidase family protein [unclassified Gilliamella]MCX8650844.1 pyridoxamine 5'-phosphate oxidase family protein [Gilliamella sp. B2779]MCX8653976.1 pyridoxamine 5'-phosphate oxidase family protein [Gilliamella sp. B2737]MCX8657260.1 pyridoxamine 5'-phosphate oxidase family protein [Gilliamella sp. B2894]MCX8691471.1 pyridoxamine 5'-phosphate oxidase family protein [Gilliamella sp. B2776]MCX8693540.1 pyridoxamine 5'-phosphate oxidase family protein [Gil
MAESKTNNVQDTIDSLHETVLTVILSTINKDGEVETSYSPYFFDGNDYYVLISNLAPHAQNMKTNPHISFIIIDDEAKTKNIYARKRLTSQAIAEIVDKDSNVFEKVIDQMAKRVSKMVYMLCEMNDFNLFKIKPIKGRVVIGFGKTYLIDHQNKMITPVDETYVANQKKQSDN